MKIQEAHKDIQAFIKKRMDELAKEMGEISSDTPAMSVSFMPQMRLTITPVAIPDIQLGMYIDKSQTVFAEVIHINRGNNIVQMEVHTAGEDALSKRFETMSTGMFSLLFNKFEEPHA